MRHTERELKKIKDKASKLRALAERGVGGEADNAKKMLAEYLLDNKLGWDDVFKHNVAREFSVNNTNGESVLLQKVIFSVSPRAKQTIHPHPSDKNRIIIKAALTDAEKVEVINKQNAFWADFREVVEKAMLAFINVNESHFTPEIENDRGEKMAADETMMMETLMSRPTSVSMAEQSDVRKIMTAIRKSYYRKANRTIDWE